MAPKDQFFTSNDVSNGAREVEKGVSVADSGRGWCGEMEWIDKKNPENPEEWSVKYTYTDLNMQINLNDIFKSNSEN